MCVSIPFLFNKFFLSYFILRSPLQNLGMILVHYLIAIGYISLEGIQDCIFFSRRIKMFRFGFQGVIS